MATRSSPTLPTGHAVTNGVRIPSWRRMFSAANADVAAGTLLANPFASGNNFRNEADDGYTTFLTIAKELHLANGRFLVNRASAGNLDIWCGFSGSAIKTGKIQVFGFDCIAEGEWAGLNLAGTNAPVDIESPASGQVRSGLRLATAHNLLADDPYSADSLDVQATNNTQVLTFGAGPHAASRIPYQALSGGTTFYMSKVLRFTGVPYYAYMVYVPFIDASTTMCVLGRTW